MSSPWSLDDVLSFAAAEESKTARYISQYQSPDELLQLQLQAEASAKGVKPEEALLRPRMPPKVCFPQQRRNGSRQKNDRLGKTHNATRNVGVTRAAILNDALATWLCGSGLQTSGRDIDLANEIAPSFFSEPGAAAVTRHAPALLPLQMFDEIGFFLGIEEEVAEQERDELDFLEAIIKDELCDAQRKQRARAWRAIRKRLNHTGNSSSGDNGSEVFAAVLDPHPTSVVVAAAIAESRVQTSNTDGESGAVQAATEQYHTLAESIGLWRMARVVGCSSVDGKVRFSIRWISAPEGTVKELSEVPPIFISFSRPPTLPSAENRQSPESSDMGTEFDYSSDMTRSLLRISRAAVRRQACEALLRYHLYIDCVPSTPKTLYLLTTDHLNSIVSQAICIPRHREELEYSNSTNDPSSDDERKDYLLKQTLGSRMDATKASLKDEVLDAYRSTMNRIIFDADCCDPANHGALLKLELPPIAEPGLKLDASQGQGRLGPTLKKTSGQHREKLFFAKGATNPAARGHLVIPSIVQQFGTTARSPYIFPPFGAPENGTVTIDESGVTFKPNVTFQYAAKTQSFVTKSVLTSGTVLQVLQAVRAYNEKMSKLRILYTGFPPTDPRYAHSKDQDGQKAHRNLFHALQQGSSVEDTKSRSSYPEGTDLFMHGVWTFDSWVKKQDACIKRIVVRAIKEDWPADLGELVHSTFVKAMASRALEETDAENDEDGSKAQAVAANGPDGEYNVNETYMDNFQGDQHFKLRSLLMRINLEMSDRLFDVTRRSLEEYVNVVAQAASPTVTVKAKDDVTVMSSTCTDDFILDDDKTNLDEPQGALFGLRLEISQVDYVLNENEIAAAQADIDAWLVERAQMEAEGKPIKKDERPPCEPVEPKMGRVFEYNVSVTRYCDAILKFFDDSIAALQGMQQPERFCMQRLFFRAPKLARVPILGSSALAQEVDELPGHTRWIDTLRDRLMAALNKGRTAPNEYLRQFDDWLEFLNLDVHEYVASQVFSGGGGEEDDDDASHHTDGDAAMPRVNLSKLMKVLNKHEVERAAIVAQLTPSNNKKSAAGQQQQNISSHAETSQVYVHCGAFAVDVLPIKTALVRKHTEIIQQFLVNHAETTADLAEALDAEFHKLGDHLEILPSNIEETAEMEEFIEHVAEKTAPLEDLLAELMSYSDKVLVPAKFRVTEAQSHAMFDASGWPFRIKAKTEAATERCVQCREKFAEEMALEQAAFVRTLEQLEHDVQEYIKFNALEQVDKASEVGRDLDERLIAADKAALLFNSREGLFEVEDITEYSSLSATKKRFEPYISLWKTAAEWQKNHAEWLNGPWEELDAEQCEERVDSMNQIISKTIKFFTQGAAASEEHAAVARHIKDEVTSFKPHVPLVMALRNRGMAGRHWEEIGEKTGVERLAEAVSAPGFTLSKVVEFGLDSHLEVCEKVAESAAKEYTIEQTLDKMETDWEPFNLDVRDYRGGTGVLAGFDEINALLDEQVTMTQAMAFSAFKGPFEERIDAWNAKLMTVSEVLDNWLKVQRDWMYLQPIFESDDIIKQLPAEAKKFATVDKNWRQTISSARKHPDVISFCDNEKLNERFREGVKHLDQVQKGLNQYLETKRDVFPRFYFLSNDDLLTILSESKDVVALQPHFKKVFEAVEKVTFGSASLIEKVISPEKESIDLSHAVDPKGHNVESWLLLLEGEMRNTIRDIMKAAIADYYDTPRIDWMQYWPSMHVLNGSQLHWTRQTEELFEQHGTGAPEKALERQRAELADMVVLVRGKLPKGVKTKVGALAVIDVHARDTMVKLVNAHTESTADFLWQSQLRYYWEELGSDHEDGDLWAMMVAARRPYGYEYLGNTFRLVITPLTDKCYLTLMGALQMILGGAPAGPAGTGKTETTKDLSKALAVQCVVFNCSDALGYLEMGKFAKGLSSCGAWACYDEFNRINIEVLSVVGQQVMEIQQAIVSGVKRMIFMDSDIAVKAGFGVFITMNPGYAGRSELPDSLSARFRPVAMMVPDYALIGEIMFLAYGFSEGKVCGQKMVTTFKLCSEQCSSQPHYDYGMRAVKTVIVAAGNLKQAEPNTDELVLLMRALQDVNVPKFLDQDAPLFRGIIGDLFPGKKRPELDYGALFATLKRVIKDNGLQPHPWFITKVIQLYEMIVVRHGLMLVGPTGGGKTKCLRTLQETLGGLKKQKVQGFAYEKVIIYQLNPKSITMGQMYGAFDPNTREWQDGIMSTMYRLASMSPTSDRKWMMFNGPVDAIWIENMNTVLDDNKKLCLSSGEIMKMSEEMTMMFEVEDLSVASPATVSRVGIIYMEPSALGLDPLVQSWLGRLPPSFSSATKQRLIFLMDHYVGPGIDFLRDNMKELSPTVNNNIAESLMRLLDCYFEPFYLKEGRPAPSAAAAEAVSEKGSLDELFIFCLVWSIGATTDDMGRTKFDSWLRGEMAANGMSKQRPPTIAGDAYSVLFDLGTQKWIKWMDTMVEPFSISPKQSFSEIVVPTTDSVRNTYLLDLLLRNNKHVLMVGETGTGKTINISQYLQGQSRVQGRSIDSSFLSLAQTFSATASANQTQDFLDGKFDKRKRGVFGPPAGKRYCIHIDDMNMPLRETYGAQPPIEILRQWFDQGGWYDRLELTFRSIIDIIFIGSMGPAGGGRQMVTPRFLRHFNTIGYVEMSDESKTTIFSTILSNWLGRFPPSAPSSLPKLAEPMVKATIKTFNKVIAELLPTPARCHYIFNLRDLSKVFQGLLMGEPKQILEPVQLVRLWAHECVRVFEDRMINDHDHKWFRSLMEENCLEFFKMPWDGDNVDKCVNPHHVLIYGDFMIPGADPAIYAEIPDMDELKHRVEEYLSEHNAESKTPMPLVMFSDALEHVCRIARVIRQPQGNALLLGVGGSGRQSMTKLATYIAGYKLFSVTIAKGYGQAEWRDDLRHCLLYAGIQDKPIVFMFSDAQVVMESMVEDLNNILNAGDVPNLYATEDEDSIVQACRVECQRKRIPPTKLNIFAQYIIRVRRNLHVCLCMSPLGNTFRDRLRNFPSIVNCCTADWFTLWPRDALISVADATLSNSDMTSALGSNMEAMVEMFGAIHLSVEESSKEFWDMLRRRNYVTPTSYLELLSSFKSLLKFKNDQVNTKRERLQKGLDKLASTKAVVSTLQKEIEELAPILDSKSKEVSEMMIVIKKDTADAEVIKTSCEKEEANANVKAAATKEIADSAQADLDKALPALAKALKSLDSLKKSDIDEVKALKTPPSGVKLTMEVCMHIFEVKPEMIKDPDSGKKVPDYFGSSKKTILSDAKKFMDSMIHFDKDNIKDSVIQKIQPYIDNPDFEPDMIKKASVACTAICMWARAMHTYHFVALGVAPKKAALAKAQAELDVVLAGLAEAKAKLSAVVEKVENLKKAFNSAIDEKAQLEAKANQCQVRLANAEKLIGGLGGEEARWKETVETLTKAVVNVPGDVAVAAGTVSYLGPFTSDYRRRIVEGWKSKLAELSVPHTEGCDIEQTLADPVKLRQWQLCALPSDSLSTQNGIMMDTARRWPLLVDPQNQANTYIKRMGKDKEMCLNGLDIVKLSEKNFLRSLENGVRFGKWVLLENIAEVLDASLEPILMQQVFKQGGQDVIKIGDNVIPYSDTFRFFMTTKMPNPHYPPEIQVKVSIINFTVTPIGLEDQLLNICVGEELPDLAEKKSELVISNAKMNNQLYDIESQILFLLSNSKGNILDDTVLIETLAQAKVTSEEIKTKMAEAEATGKEIFERSEEYRPVAFRTSLLYFCIASLGNVDPMYQYSLPWYTTLFCRGIAEAPPAAAIEDRCASIIEYYSYMLYCNVCRSLFEEHKLMFSFLMCIQILQGDKLVDPLEWRFLISGMSLGKQQVANPDPSWIEGNVWDEILTMSGGLPFFQSFAETFAERVNEWKAIFDHDKPIDQIFPMPFDELPMKDPLAGLRRLCIVRCLRRDKLMDAVQSFVLEQDFMGRRYVEPPPMNLKDCFNDSSVVMPLIFILSTGSDPNKDMLQLAEEMGVADSMKSIALGDGQGKLAEGMIDRGIEKGDWVVLQNCHLYVSWMPTLETICEDFEAEKIHPDFRLWLTSKPSPSFPMSVLQNGVKMTKEPPKGLRANLKSLFIKMTDTDIVATSKPNDFSKLLFALCFFHALVIERKRFGPLGWNIPYSFNDTDLDITVSQLKLYVDKYEEIPFSVLQLLTSMVNYGGRITDDKDMRTSDIIVASLLSENATHANYPFSKSGIYRTIDCDLDSPLQSYQTYIDQLPLNAGPEVFGMHDNAAITCAINETVEIFGIIVSLQPRTASGGGVSREDQIANIAKGLETDMIPPWDEEKVKLVYPIDYNESMNTILGQEIAKYNKVVRVLNESLKELQLALRGMVVLSADLEAMGNSLFDQEVPAIWTKVAYPSLKPLIPWFNDFLARTAGFMQKWVEHGIPSTYWISGFFFPQGFLTAILQNYARKFQMPIDTVSFSYVFRDEPVEFFTEKPETGAYTYGLFLEGSVWNKEKHSLDDPRPKELFSPMPVVHKIPEQNREAPKSGIYRCPVYKILTRRGVLSTTGHSTNFVLWLEVPSDKPTCFRSSLVSETNAQVQFCDNEYWVKGGVAAFCALRY